MRTTFNAANVLSVFFLLALIPQCLGRPASALFGHGLKALPLAERRDSAIVERRESVLSRRDTVVPLHDGAEIGVEASLATSDVPVVMENVHQRLWLKQDLSEAEESDAVDQIIQNMDYESANLEARQVSSYYAVFQTSAPADASNNNAATSYYNPGVTNAAAAASPPSSSTASTSTSIISSSVAAVTNSGSTSSIASTSTATTALVAVSSVYPSGAATKTAIITPVVLATTVHGTASHAPMMTYVSGQKSAALPSIPVTPQINYLDQDMQTQYAMWNGSGTLIVNSGNSQNLVALSTKPSMSRDQGKGGNIAGVNIFVFADTGTYSAPPTTGTGAFTGFVSNSIAVDRGLGPASGLPVTLSDPIGGYVNKAGAPRGFFPLTLGEQAYNNLMIPYGQRWAIWPESSFIPLNPTTSLMYAPIVYCNTTGGSSFTYAGTTLIEITVPSIGGPVANRIAPLLFPKGGVEWGCLGGVRSFGSNGINGGKVYIFGASKTGLFIGRTNATQVTDATSYQFFQGSGIWNSTVPTLSTKTGIFSQGAFSTVDIFYSPRHLTFIMVFQNVYCDNNIYWRYLKPTSPILPQYAGGTQEDIVENLTKYPWGPTQVLISLPAAGSSYTYGGGSHAGYFGADDISNGGTKMLLSWTAPTGQAGGSLATSYATLTAAITFA